MAILAMALSGCMSDEITGNLPFGVGAERPEEVTRMGAYAQAQADRSEENRSVIIDALMARRSVLLPGSPYDSVARSVLDASSRTAEAELQQARLRSRAADKNWLPSLGPNLSLANFSSFIATLVIDQVIFDNGRKKAEREFARADVEAAAVNLAQDQNDRVHTALVLYLTVEEERDRARVAEAGLGRMRVLERNMTARVEGGLADLSELAVIRAKVAELEASAEAATRKAASAEAELAAMSARPLDEVHGLSSVALPSGVTPLALHLAEAEMKRDMAQAAIARAGLLPGLSAGGAISNQGTSGPDLQLSSDSGFGFSTPENLRAVEASKEASTRRVDEVREEVNRKLAALAAERDGMAANARRSAELATQSEANATLFQRQFEAGTRSVTELANVIETATRLADDAIQARYQSARIDVELARTLGVLADGAAM
ncbi:TolC family protein [Maritimibacter sp. DP1N21-5]|uniref:TolC family protein n=1 Tax=Maritimibacter sp. DP1N21-5 TaxID=2836867 RepID=UPI001C43B836|nr:TolC family protein [Maritimibacter sp. DP1N21-5]MBV7407857.1 TolC family protein [Maritimibacter sp. DP1N21-5]